MSSLFGIARFDGLGLSDNSEPVRRIVRRSHGGQIAQFPSTKSRTPVECESILELDYVRLAEVDAEVTGILHQPCEIIWLDGDRRKRSHIPDFAIARRGRAHIVEVKPWLRKADPRIETRTNALRKKLGRQGIAYTVVTDRTIRWGVQLANAKTILNGLGFQPTASERDSILGIVDAGEVCRIDGICRAMGAQPSFANVVLAMVIARELEVTSHRDRAIDDVRAVEVRRRP